MTKQNEVVIGLALGSGSARGFAHIGIIRELEENGIVPKVICGSSVGAMVGASWATNRMDKLESWARQLTGFQTARFLNINSKFAGFIDHGRFDRFLSENVADDDDLIENFKCTYGAVSTDLSNARETWIREGSLKEAVWTSMSLPGLFPARRYGDRWHTDGGLVNPVPVSLCHSLGANLIIAVNLNGDIMGRHRTMVDQQQEGSRPEPAAESVDTEVEKDAPAIVKWSRENRLTQTISSLTDQYATSFLSSDEPASKESGKVHAPSVLDAMAAAINIMQDRITRSRMAGDPPDILLVPRLSNFRLLDMGRAAEAIDEGRRCVRRMLPEIKRLISPEANSE